MAVDIEELIIAPFREVVDRGKEAVANAEAARGESGDGDGNGNDTAQRMAKAGKAVVREGERALKRLQPLWNDQVEKYGDTFKAAMSKNDEIEDKRRKLEDLLYDFEDYVEIDTFDEGRFTELQGAAKSLALHVLDIIKRLKLDGVPVSPPPKVTAFPPLPPLPPGALLQGAVKPPSRTSTTRSQQSAPRATARSNHDVPPSPVEPSSRISRAPSAVSNGGNSDSRRRRLTPQGLYRRDTTVSHASSHYSVETLPPYPSEEFNTAAPGFEIPPPVRPSHSVHEGSAESPQDTGPQPPAPGDRIQAAAPRPGQRRSSTPDVLASRGSATPWVSDQAAATASPRLTTRPLPIREAVIPEGQVVTTRSSFTNNEALAPGRPLSPFQTPDGGGRTSSLSSAPPPPPLSLPSAAAEIDQGLMASEDWKTVISEPNSSSRALHSVSSREPDCSIGPKSSLYQMKGFCEGAQAFKQGGHLQGVKKVQGYVAGVTTQTGKCISCGYAHQYNELSLDVNWDPKANFSSSKVRFRIRFLYKSHLVTERLPEAYYGCLFCAQTGSVVREGDATVFPDSDALFRHLARHPQPLPEVPGVTVLYGKEFAPDDQRLNDFDVHFLEPPDADLGIPTHLAAEIARLPVATATKMHVQRYGEKKLPRPDGVSEKGLLQFFIGARIVGVEFPVRWGGKWARGWHDGQWGAFPAKCIELEKPRRNETPPLMTQAAGATTVSVVTRWKWDPRDAADKGWLAFDKGETITNVGWIDREHWCWSGTNRKGQLGLFPRSHVQFDKVKEDAPAPIGTPLVRPSTAGGPGKAKRGFFGRNKNASVAPSSASSISGGSSVLEIHI
ncbi:c072eb4d-7147-47d1-99f8-fcc1fd18cc88 [Thermothielavioides terrestris]|uniref:C072eb4d-7147-47d1-99f8-fcc1fd18cc88 n=1 Tax=Thermothielavioides terrestris TaxID=2587410 RepID=A0A3S5CXL2_9PEZI|nr:c072eb4d-7147-47d1-99f8-fcc1fd18cc88 [Thermothielavioides terrestris]